MTDRETGDGKRETVHPRDTSRRDGDVPRESVSGLPSPVSRLLFVNASQVVTCRGPARARRGREMNDAAIVTGVAVAVEGERIVEVAPQADL